IDAVCSSIAQFWQDHGRASLLVMSFHGLPERSRRLGDPYYQHCQTSARLIAKRLGLADDDWKLAFQSRFGKAEWIKPYCVELLKALPGEGVKAVDVVCPGFAVDCLETLEEIAIANRKVFLAAGGEQYRYIPALNARSDHARALAGLILRNRP
ncbi:MAG: ferrochelatase, partial [Methylococcaceae bacterium]|nr:ferrochelatase [Methylococcaceae bacterium]